MIVETKSGKPCVAFGIVWLMIFFEILVPVSAHGNTTNGNSLDEINKQLSNPLSSVWAL